MACRFRSFIFMDCETTGLESWSKITELCLIAIQTEHLLTTLSNRLPRAINKLTLCFNPRKTIHPTASQITGLYIFKIIFLSIKMQVLCVKQTKYQVFPAFLYHLCLFNQLS